MEKQIKFRLFHYYEEREDGVLVERHAEMGQVVDIPRKEDVERGDRLGAFYSDEERKAIADGSFDGSGAPFLRDRGLIGPQDRSPEFPGGRMESGEVDAAVTGDGEFGRTAEAGAGGSGQPSADIDGKSAEEIAELINSQKLTVQQTVDLAGGDPDLAEVVLDAESLATNNEPRKGVQDALESMIARATTG